MTDNTMDAETAEFFAGPHDGRLLTMQEIGRHCQLVKVTNQDEERVFVLMPSILEMRPRGLLGDRGRRAE
jgi:hypothetical protein